MTVQELLKEICVKTGITIDNAEDISFIVIDNHDRTYKVLTFSNWLKLKDSNTGNVFNAQFTIPRAKIDITPLSRDTNELWSIVIPDKVNN